MSAPIRRRTVLALSAAAFAWGIVLVVGAFIASVYSDGDTLVGANGVYAGVLMAVPAVAAGLVALSVRGDSPRRGLAWGAACGLTVLAFLTLPSVGLLLLPPAIFLFLAIAVMSPGLGKH